MDATQQLLNERGRTHGDFNLHAQCTQMLKSIITNQTPETKTFTYQQREALDMICHKIGRIVAGDPDFRDHWDDIAGYARLIAERCSK